MDQDSPDDRSKPRVRGVAQSGVRIANERAVLTLVTINPGASNADLARLSGLGPQTISRILTDLEARGLVIRGQVLRGRRGQPATPMFLNPQGAFSIGIELSWRHVELVLIDMSGKVLAGVRHQYDFPDAGRIFTTIATETAALADNLSPDQRSRLLGIGVASPATIARHIDLLGASPAHKAAWAQINIAERIAADTGLDTVWFNDGNAACWAEIVAHPSPRPVNLAYFQIGAFIAAGIMTIEGLWEGPTGRAANLGAIIVVDRSGQPTALHNVSSLDAFGRRLIDAGVAPPSGSPHAWDWDGLEPHASDWLDDAAHALAQAVVSTQAMVELEKIIVDGILPRHVLARLLDGLGKHLGLLTPDRPHIDSGRLGVSAAAVGAAELPLFRHFFYRAWSVFSA
jgi:predicted NBD/HSP70 family sugar kinase